MGTTRPQIEERLFAVKLSGDLLSRLRFESMHSGKLIRSIVADALDAYLPEKIEFIVHDSRKPSPRRRAKLGGSEAQVG